jgi:hypothetical protein
MQITGPETRKCPPEYQARITRKFGVNRFGEPNFKIVWNQSQFIRMGKLTGYRDIYQGDGQPCWMIMRWKPPEFYGSPKTYYRETFEQGSGRYATGEYPWKGRYEIVQSLIAKEFKDGQLLISSMPLCHYLVDMIIPLILQWQSLTLEEQLAANQLAEQEQHKREVAEVAEKMMENMPTWIHPVSYSRQGCRTSLLDQKMFKIQKAWDRLSRRGLKPVFQKGFAQGNAPTRVKN